MGMAHYRGACMYKSSSARRRDMLDLPQARYIRVAEGLERTAVGVSLERDLEIAAEINAVCGNAYCVGPVIWVHTTPA